MSKGARKRQHYEEKKQACERVRLVEKRYHRYACVLATVSVLLCALTMAVQIFTLQSISAGEQTAEAAAILSSAVPMGILAVILMSGGTLLASCLLFARKESLSAIGVALLLIGAAFLAVFIGALAECFPFKEIITGTTVREVGLNFNKLFLRHGTAFFPPLFLFIAQGFGLAALKKRELATVMDPDKSASTVTLGE